MMENLTRRLQGAPRLKRYVPQSKYLAIVGLGDEDAVALRGGWGLRGSWVWRLKDWIDTTWMAKYTSEVRDALKTMASTGAGAAAEAEREGGAIAQGKEKHKMFCAGCGSKVGPDVLSSVMQLLRESAYGTVVPELEEADDAAILDTKESCGTLVHSVDFFTSFVEDPFVFGAIAANHALSDVYAMGARPKSALAIAVVPYGSAEKLRDGLFQLLAGACSVLAAAGCKLGGGHSVQGPEMALGFAAVGEVRGDGVILKKSGLREGHKLILTKALGTGVILAGEMRGMCKGVWLDGAIESMLKLNEAAVDVALNFGATACTDVTGFGLVGHLREMVVASGASVQLEMDRIPLLEGALELAEQGVKSSLYEGNFSMRKVKAPGGCGGEGSGDADSRLSLLFDPQTSGGMLFSVPPSYVQSCLAELRACGFSQSACIGTVMAIDQSEIIEIV